MVTFGEKFEAAQAFCAGGQASQDFNAVSRAFVKEARKQNTAVHAFRGNSPRHFILCRARRRLAKASRSCLGVGQEVGEMIRQANSSSDAFDDELGSSAGRSVLHFFAHSQELRALELYLLLFEGTHHKLASGHRMAPIVEPRLRVRRIQLGLGAPFLSYAQRFRGYSRTIDVHTCPADTLPTCP